MGLPRLSASVSSFWHATAVTITSKSRIGQSRSSSRRGWTAHRTRSQFTFPTAQLTLLINADQHVGLAWPALIIHKRKLSDGNFFLAVSEVMILCMSTPSMDGSRSPPDASSSSSSTSKATGRTADTARDEQSDGHGCVTPYRRDSQTSHKSVIDSVSEPGSVNIRPISLPLPVPSFPPHPHPWQPCVLHLLSGSPSLPSQGAPTSVPGVLQPPTPPLPSSTPSTPSPTGTSAQTTMRPRSCSPSSATSPSMPS